MLGLGPLNGLALALMPMTIGVVFPAYISVVRQIESGLERTRLLLVQLQEANQQLTELTGQAEALSAIEERNRLARRLHDSVSQTIFSVSLQARAAQILLDRDPDRLRSQLEQLRCLSQTALEEMRSLISQLHPTQKEPAARPTP
jgi:signal transduction histidine kinase